MKPSALLWYGMRKPFEDDADSCRVSAPRASSDAPRRRRTPRAIGSAITTRNGGRSGVWTRGLAGFHKGQDNRTNIRDVNIRFSHASALSQPRATVDSFIASDAAPLLAEPSAASPR